MCFKKNCWLFKHTQTKCDKLKNQFKEQFGQKLDKKAAAQHISNFKKT